MDLELRDFFFFEPQAGRAGGESCDPEVRQTASYAGKGLRVEMKASHAGMVNLNKVMYSPKGMEASLPTWVFPIQRPVQIHHADAADPIGRVIGARFVPHTYSPESQKDFSDGASILLDGGGDLFTAVALLKESGVLGNPDWEGVGTLVLEGLVTDASAIEKILDGRYLGVSVSQRPRQAYCSICHQDWVKDGPCSHPRGEVDEESGEEMFLIVGETKYKEVSYVNHPADERASTTSVASIDLQALIDSIQTPVDTEQTISPTYLLVDSVEPLTPVTPEGEDSDTEDVAVVSDGRESEDISKEDPESTSEPAPEGESEGGDAAPPGEVTLEEALRILFEDEENFTDEMAEVINEELEREVEEEVEGGDKLTAEGRRKLPGKVFCAPKRGFPVNSCARYTAAKRLLGRYKGPGDKSKILSCIESKGRKLGCSGAKKDCSEVTLPLLEEWMSSLSTEDLATFSSSLLEKLVSLGIDTSLGCLKCAALNDRISTLEEENASMEGKRISAIKEYAALVAEIREEWLAISQDYSDAVESHMEEFSKIGDSLREILVVLDGSKEEVAKSLILADLLELLIETARIQKEVTVGSGSVAPSTPSYVTIDDVEVAAQEGEGQEAVLDVSEETKALIALLNEFHQRFGIDYVRSYFDALQMTGKVSKDLTLANLLKVV